MYVKKIWVLGLSCLVILYFSIQSAQGHFNKIKITPLVHFDAGKIIIKQASYPVIDDIIDTMRKNPEIIHVRIEGHTDHLEKRGNKALLQLSKKRARAVFNYMVQQGIEAQRLEIIGYGDSRPLTDNATIAGRARNRRVEFNALDDSQKR